MTTKTDGDRLLRAVIELLAAPGWAGRARSHEPLTTLVEEIAPGRLARARATAKRKAQERVEAARWYGPVPAWAKRLVNKHAPNERVTWHEVTRPGSSGHYQFGAGITVTAGVDPIDNKRVLLHELAHARTVNHGHDHVFWDECYRLAVAENMVELMKARTNQTRSFTAAQRRARQNRSTQ